MPATSLADTVAALAARLGFDELVCLLDSALRAGWAPEELSFTRRAWRLLRPALAPADPRSESPFETLLRLLLAQAGLGPETLQRLVYDADGRIAARLDLAWPSVKLALEADGRAYHDSLTALYHDRERANDLEVLGWMILRFTWADLKGRPGWVVSQVRRALAALAVR